MDSPVSRRIGTFQNPDSAQIANSLAGRTSTSISAIDLSAASFANSVQDSLPTRESAGSASANEHSGFSGLSRTEVMVGESPQTAQF